VNGGAVRFKNIAKSEDKRALLERHISNGSLVPEAYCLRVRSDLFAELKGVGINRMEIVDISCSDGNDMMSMQVKLRGPKSGNIYVYTPINEEDKEGKDELVLHPKPEELTTRDLKWKQREIIREHE
jgi:hypothetical protein